MRQWTIDAFSSQPLGGNTACVVEPLDEWPSEDWMQRLARENNAGATAYMVGGATLGHFDLRWFTPSVEVTLCGHATLAAAHVLFNEIGYDFDESHFQTASGPITARRAADRIEMDMPAQQATLIPTPASLAEALGTEPVEVWSGPYLVALLSSGDEVMAVKPDLAILRAISLAHGGQGNVGIAAVLANRSRFDVVDRFFAPGYGIEEDSATGSFHCILTPIMAEKLATRTVRFSQASIGRGAEFECTLAGDRVLVRGQAVTTVDGTLRVEPA